MTDVPVIFSAQMVRALLEDRKTMTRRLAWRWPRSFGDSRPIVGNVKTHGDLTPWQRVKPGDRLWVREGLGFEFVAMRPTYAAGPGVEMVPNAPPEFCGPAHRYASRPAIHMPREFSRITLVVTATKIERVQEISERDAIAEGITSSGAYFRAASTAEFTWCRSATKAFGQLWASLHGAESWAANPEVVALTFTVHKRNVDALEKAA